MFPCTAEEAKELWDIRHGITPTTSHGPLDVLNRATWAKLGQQWAPLQVCFKSLRSPLLQYKACKYCYLRQSQCAPLNMLKIQARLLGSLGPASYPAPHHTWLHKLCGLQIATTLAADWTSIVWICKQFVEPIWTVS